MAAFAVDAEEWGDGTAAGDGAIRAAFGARAIGALAPVLGVGVVLSAEGTCRLFLFARRMVMSEGKAVLAVGGCGRRLKDNNAAWLGE